MMITSGDAPSIIIDFYVCYKKIPHIKGTPLKMTVTSPIGDTSYKMASCDGGTNDDEIRREEEEEQCVVVRSNRGLPRVARL